MTVRWRHIAILLVALPAAALLFAWSGLFNVAASTGHWRVTEWFLEFAMRSSVRTYSIGTAVPDLDDPALLRPAAGHFRQGCAVCHGAPGEARPPFALRMLPAPPDLARAAATWDDAELFRIVRHGLRFTGMPAWPASARDDEVWAMVALLRALPAMDAGDWRDLAGGVAQGSPAARCAGCHGTDGNHADRLIPRLAGQSEAYLLASLRAYAQGWRTSGMMATAAAALTESERRALARHFAGQRPPSSGGESVA